MERVSASVERLDTLIAAAALANGASLIHNNQREFPCVPCLMLEDWLLRLSNGIPIIRFRVNR